MGLNVRFRWWPCRLLNSAHIDVEPSLPVGWAGAQGEMGKWAPDHQYCPQGSICLLPSIRAFRRLRKGFTGREAGVVPAAVKEGAGAMGLRDFLPATKQTGAICKW